MIGRWMKMTIGGALALFLAATGAWAQQPSAASDGVACEPQTESMPVEGRTSPYDSTVITIADRTAKVCYGRPSSRGRTMIGGEHVPYGELWRTGANEPTVIHLPYPAEIAGIAVEPGEYSIYTIPGPSEWTVIVNRATSQWGHESRYTSEVRAQEVGRATVPAERTDGTIETFTIRSRPTGSASADLILEWEQSRIRVPLKTTIS